MGFFDIILGRKTAKAEANVKVLDRIPEVKRNVVERQSGQPISYDGGLVGKLKEDHAELFAIYGSLITAAKLDRYQQIPQLLRDFKLMLQTHLMVENVRFYVYLQQNLGGDEDVAGFIKDVRKEMDGIARVAVTFTNKYSVIDFGAETKSSFITELEAIGAILVKRISMEESRLYTMYQPY